MYHENANDDGDQEAQSQHSGGDMTLGKVISFVL